MALYELTTMELDAVCGGKWGLGKVAKGKAGGGDIDIDITIINIKQKQNNKTTVVGSRDVDASNNQGVNIGNIG